MTRRGPLGHLTRPSRGAFFPAASGKLLLSLPPDNVFRPDRRSGLGSKKRGSAPPSIHRISKITLKVVVFHLRRSSHLSYTSQVISQRQMNATPTPRISSPNAPDGLERVPKTVAGIGSSPAGNGSSMPAILRAMRPPTLVRV